MTSNKRPAHPTRWWVAMAMLLGACSNASGPGSSVPSIGQNAVTILIPSATNGSSAEAINDAGQIGGRMVDAQIHTSAWIWHNGVSATYPGWDVRAIDATGDLLVVPWGALPWNSYLTGAGTSTAITVPGAWTTEATGINASGEIVGGYILTDTSAYSHAFVYQAGTYTLVPDPPGALGMWFTGVNDAGDLIGAYRAATGGASFVWRHGDAAPTPLSFGAFTSFGLTGINSSGELVGIGRDSQNKDHAFIWTSGTLKYIEVPFGSEAMVHGINNLGQVVGDYWNSGRWAFELDTR